MVRMSLMKCFVLCLGTQSGYGCLKPFYEQNYLCEYSGGDGEPYSGVAER